MLSLPWPTHLGTPSPLSIAFLHSPLSLTQGVEVLALAVPQTLDQKGSYFTFSSSFLSMNPPNLLS